MWRHVWEWGKVRGKEQKEEKRRVYKLYIPYCVHMKPGIGSALAVWVCHVTVHTSVQGGTW